MPVPSSATDEVVSPAVAGGRINPWLLVVLLISVHLVLSVGNITAASATADELVHLSSGWTALHWRDYRLNTEHPPLAKMVAAAAVSSWLPGAHPSTGQPLPEEGAQRSWSSAMKTWNAAATHDTAQWYFAHYFSFPIHDSYLAAHGIADPAQVPPYTVTPAEAWLWEAHPELVRARMMMLLFPAVLAVALFMAGRQTAGTTAGLLAAGLLVLDPSFIAHGGLVTTDVASATAMFLSVWAMRRWMHDPRPATGAALAGVTGIAATIKFSAVALGPLLAILAAGVALSRPSMRLFSRALMGLALAACGAFVLVWAVYGFRWSASADPVPIPLPTQQLVERRAAVEQILARGEAATHDVIERETGSAPLSIADRLLMALHRARLVPEGWTHGFAFVRAFSAPRTAFLDGRLSETGFPDYFVRSFLYKSPMALLGSGILLMVLIAAGRLSRGSLWWWGFPVVFLFVLASTSRVNIGHRHILMIYPFIWLLCAEALIRLREWRPRVARVAVPLLAACAVLAPFAVLSPQHGVQPMYGHHLAYFNELAGGPLGGRNRLVDSNLDWGQDVLRLGHWWHAREDRPLIAWAATGAMDPRRIGVPVLNTPIGYPFAPHTSLENLPAGSMLALSVTSASGILDDAATRHELASFLQGWILVHRVGYTIDIYQREAELRSSPPAPPR